MRIFRHYGVTVTVTIIGYLRMNRILSHHQLGATTSFSPPAFVLASWADTDYGLLLRDIRQRGAQTQALEAGDRSFRLAFDHRFTTQTPRNLVAGHRNFVYLLVIVK